MNRCEVSQSEKNFIIEGCLQNCRQDGRSCDEARSYMVTPWAGSAPSPTDQPQPLALSHGSARVGLATGETNVLVSVRADLVLPSHCRPTEGVVVVNVDLMQERKENLESILSELFLPHLVDTKQLCVVPFQYVWRLSVDVLILASGGGSLLGVCGRGIQAALSSARLPKVQKMPSHSPHGENMSLEVDGDFKSSTSIPGLRGGAFIETVSILKPKRQKKAIFVLDASTTEEACAVATVHMVIDQTAGGKAKICALCKAGQGSLPFTLLQDLTSFVGMAIERKNITSLAHDTSIAAVDYRVSVGLER